ncbi:uncharacterized protein PITG_02738 [Phytophthora infestans T30-4]|uniref:Uncharacterized protein n=1 Tax=Phytophthora infestans (strain T30-4) TaxID=403677 RepID=D0MX36_PHYIT|nr:uncharacterized protein PITG_02738 [Phytophthora infestans T30-4]EEY64199.1 hypothetical protein PITG_02738 [Phytophthora infestans T30-4]|eukprot:XP_002907635.1 hypothetical protein PITG_02738 [Phytophthora infestans T30-4]
MREALESSGQVKEEPGGYEEADAAGYTVIRRRSSCDETSKQPQRPRRGSMSALSHSSSLLASISPAPSSSVPPGFQPLPAASRVTLRPPPGLTPAASGWVAKAAVPAEHTSKLEEPPVEAFNSAVQDDRKDDDDDLLTRLGVTL